MREQIFPYRRYPDVPFRKPDHFDFGSFTSLLGTLGNTAGTIFSGVQTTKQIKMQTDAQLEAARLAAQANRSVVSDSSGSNNNMIMIIIVVIVVLIVIGLVIWAILRKK